jgi:hypothetical protein
MKGDDSMDEYLYKIDIIRERLGIGYKEAKDALDQADGDVVQAIVNLEECNDGFEEEVQRRRDKLVDQIRSIFKKGNVTRIKVKKGEKVVLEIPATIGALGVLGMLASAEFAVLAGLGTIAAMFNNYTLEVEKKDGETEQHHIEL